MKRSSLLLGLGLLLPTVVFALDFSNVSSQYADAPFSNKEAAGISVLTHLGAVSGNPDGTFAASRTLNRAEFLKVVLLADGDDSGVPTDCFPDVKKAMWFSAYVCRAKDLGMVAGYPDGLFHPERPVNYAEALKILVKQYGLETDVQDQDEWYHPYLRAAALSEVSFPESVLPATSLTRGQMARLIAAFVSNDKGELDSYRNAEAGQFSSASSESSVSSSSTSSASSSSTASGSTSSSTSSSSSVSSSSSSSYAGFPIRSHFMMIGSTTLPLAGAPFSGGTAGKIVRGADVTFRKHIKSIDTLSVVDATGKLYGTLKPFTTTFDEVRYIATFEAGQTFEIAANTQPLFGIVAKMKERYQGGQSEELVEVVRFSLILEDKGTGITDNVVADVPVYPKHQTTQSILSSVKNAGDPQAALTAGTNKVIGAFSFGMTAIAPSRALVQGLDFTVNKTSSVVVGNWQLGIDGSLTRVFCSANATTISCPDIPASIGLIEAENQPRKLQLYGDISIDQGATNQSLQVSLNNAGQVDQAGSIRWSDEVGTFNWADVTLPVMGTLWK